MIQIMAFPFTMRMESEVLAWAFDIEGRTVLSAPSHTATIGC